MAHGTTPTSQHFALLGILAAAPWESRRLGAAPSHFGAWHCLSLSDHWLRAASSLPSVAKARETCRNGARNLKFLQFGITETHMHIKTVEEPGSHLLLSLTLLHTCSPAKGGNKLSPQTGRFSPVGTPGFKHTSGKLEQTAKKKNITTTLHFATSTSPISAINILCQTSLHPQTLCHGDLFCKS